MEGQVMRGQTVIIVSTAVATGSTVVANLVSTKSRTPAPRIVLGGFALTVGLLVMSEFQPDLAEAFAILLMIAALVGPNGTELFKLVTRLSGYQPATSTGATRSGGTSAITVH